MTEAEQRESKENPSAEPGEHELPKPSPRATRILYVVTSALVSVAAVVLVLAWFFSRRAEAKDRKQREATEKLGPKLAVLEVQASVRDRDLTLPGDVHGYEQITLYAKIAGYLQSVRVERGEHVAAGQVLGVIQSPENDEDVISARSDAIIKHINAERARRLVTPGIISEADKESAENDDRMAQATLRRLNYVSGYESVRAPFEGVVTARYVDPGALLPAATGATVSAQPIVDLARVDKLRIFVYVGQDAAPFVKGGDHVVLWQDELPEKQIHADITRCAAALDQRTRRMQCEIVIDNRTWGVLPGTTVRARLQIHSGTSPYVPNEALAIRDGKTLVAIVKDKRVHFSEVELGTTDGKNVRILRGVNPGDQIGINVPVELEDGDAIQPVDAKKTPSGAGAAGDKSSSESHPPSDADTQTSTHEKAQNIRHGEQNPGSEVSTPEPAASAASAK